MEKWIEKISDYITSDYQKEHLAEAARLAPDLRISTYLKNAETTFRDKGKPGISLANTLRGEGSDVAADAVQLLISSLTAREMEHADENDDCEYHSDPQHLLETLDHCIELSETLGLPACKAKHLTVKARNQEDAVVAYVLLTEAKEIYRDLAVTHPETYKFDIAQTALECGLLLAYYSDNLDGAHAQMNEALEAYRELSADNPGKYGVYVGDTLRNIGNLYFRQKDFLAASAAYECGMETLIPLATSRPQALSNFFVATISGFHRACNGEGYFNEEFDVARKVITKYRQIVERKPELHTCASMHATKGFATSLYWNHKLPMAREVYDHATWMYGGLGAKEKVRYSHEFSLWLSAQGTVCEEMQDIEAAFRIYSDVLAIRRDILRKYPSVRVHLCDALIDLGNILSKMGDSKGAIKAYKECVEFGRRTDNLPQMAGALYDIGLELLHERKYLRAQWKMQGAIKIYRQLIKQPDASLGDLALKLTGLAAALRARGRYVKAKEACEEAISTFRGLYRSEEDQYGFLLIDALNILGTDLLLRNDLKAARPLFEESIEFAGWLTAKGRKHCIPLLATAYQNLGVVLRGSGETQAACTAFENARALRSDMAVHYTDASSGKSLTNLGDVSIARRHIGTIRMAYEASLSANLEFARNERGSCEKPITYMLSHLKRAYT
jgi:tetratricopeptide (TPR) repeat protein